MKIVVLIFFFALGVRAQNMDSAATVAALDSKENLSLDQQLASASTSASALSIDAAPKTEAEIPLNLENDKSKTSGSDMHARILTSFLMLLVLGAGGFFFIRKYRHPRNSKIHSQIKILTQHYLGPKKSLAIVRVAGESILIGVTDHNISMLKSLSLLDEDLPEEMPEKFNTVLSKKTKEEASEDEVEEFSISGVKDVVKLKLKNMRSFS